MIYILHEWIFLIWRQPNQKLKATMSSQIPSVFFRSSIDNSRLENKIVTDLASWWIVGTWGGFTVITHAVI